MGAADLLRDLNSAGLQVSVSGANLVLRPAGKLNGKLREAVLKAKPELVRMLTPPDPAGPTFGAEPGAPVWSAQDIERYLARRARLVRWGWAAADAAEFAARLTRRDATGDTRVACTECRRYERGRCAQHRAAGLQAAAVGRELAVLLQHCPGFAPVASRPPAAGRNQEDSKS